MKESPATSQPAFTAPPVALTIAGSDCSGGAGIQADLKTFQLLGVHGTSALTCAVSECPGIVESIEALPPEFTASQAALILKHYPVGAIKTGMLLSPAHIEALLPLLSERPAPLVVDPVMIASSGDALVELDAVELISNKLCQLATLITPNLHELAALTGTPLATDEESATAAAKQLTETSGAAVLAKGGHFDNSDEATDLLVLTGGSVIRFTGRRIDGVSTHGTGCTLSAAIAAGLAHGLPVQEAVAKGKKVISTAIRTSHRWQDGENELQALNLLASHH
ncbi:bifunctional hydroxymethylpyrimidine kinase/phosphomethylpyrimidine kinase [Sulfuriroseicoccus oceanibius]|uniref:hydroxymethylpyrimidine kinase n=1 Tax=Sulfuriroseicoccus oceanibius TaxID=2707525 RepID=A0A6B3L9Z7_9BACT|nr:bifunctional hydroxymethylpyrimidine kinase/phosphomethylpyrimidine kinase [Sulfuriroseicoccus oceanibius]QQL44260.1 bifunctional hydroxymethylpyrimidine kinase/phosphomethylpyrimidine kinase [Sulfuriroseicoccus oceanibius]